MSAQEEYEAIQAIQGGIRKAVNAGIDHEEIALQIQEGFAEIGLQAVCDIKVVGFTSRRSNRWPEEETQNSARVVAHAR